MAKYTDGVVWRFLGERIPVFRGELVAKAKKIEAHISTDRRAIGRRASADRRQADTAVAPERRLVTERREKVSRRRQIDPTTCERDYTNEEVEFMHALDQYKRTSGRMFPTCSEVLEVLRGLGYEKKSSWTEPAGLDA